MSAVARTEGGNVVGWGSNGDGELGGTAGEECKLSIKACIKVPKQVEGLEHVKRVSEGSSVTSALTEAGTVYSLGDNEHGQLGIGSVEGPETCTGETPCSRTPVAVPGLSDVAGISAGISEVGEGHTLAWLNSGAGPAPLFTLTPGHGSLTMAWTFASEEFKIAYRTAPEFGEPGKWITLEHGPKTCPCSTTISGLSAGTQYEVKLDSQRHVEGKLQVTDTHTAFAIPEA
jgi:hypothetical protein